MPGLCLKPGSVSAETAAAAEVLPPLLFELTETPLAGGRGAVTFWLDEPSGLFPVVFALAAINRKTRKQLKSYLFLSNLEVLSLEMEIKY